MIFRNYLGLDIAPGQLRAISLRRKGSGGQLTGARMLGVPAQRIVPSLREPNVTDVRGLIENIRDVLGPLAGREDRLALSLPDATGRIILTEVEAPFKSRAEGVEILKWQLKNSLPAPPQEIRLDYQLLAKNEQGRNRVVVALLAAKVLQQYEEIVAAAGYGAAQIDFHCLNLYNYYRPRLDLGEDFILVGIDGGVLSLQYFEGRILAFHRSREVAPDPAGVYREVNRTLVGCRERFPRFARATVFLHSTWEEDGQLLAALQSAFERNPVPLQSQQEILSGHVFGRNPGEMRGLVAAVGAAERMM
ncbi:MAG: hypothetical protein WDA20_09530 [Desulfuromonadales bacterium]